MATRRVCRGNRGPRRRVGLANEFALEREGGEVSEAMLVALTATCVLTTVANVAIIVAAIVTEVAQRKRRRR